MSGVTSNIQTQLDGKVSFRYYACSTAANTTKKVITQVSGAGFTGLQAGDIISVIFTYGNTVPNVSLTLGSTTYTVVMPIKNSLNNVVYPYSYNLWKPYSVVRFLIYTGAKVLLIDENTFEKYNRRILLWENASIGEFAMQDISLTYLTSYFTDIEVVYYVNTSYARLESSGYLPMVDGYQYSISSSYSPTTGIIHVSRSFELDLSSSSIPIITFYNCVGANNYVTSSTSATSNICLVPYRIYGITNTDNNVV